MKKSEPLVIYDFAIQVEKEVVRYGETFRRSGRKTLSIAQQYGPPGEEMARREAIELLGATGLMPRKIELFRTRPVCDGKKAQDDVS